MLGIVHYLKISSQLYFWKLTTNEGLEEDHHTVDGLQPLTVHQKGQAKVLSGQCS